MDDIIMKSGISCEQEIFLSFYEITESIQLDRISSFLASLNNPKLVMKEIRQHTQINQIRILRKILAVAYPEFQYDRLTTELVQRSVDDREIIKAVVYLQICYFTNILLANIPDSVIIKRVNSHISKTVTMAAFCSTYKYCFYNSLTPSNPLDALNSKIIYNVMKKYFENNLITFAANDFELNF
jgi:hypothetical protein